MHPSIKITQGRGTQMMMEGLVLQELTEHDTPPTTRAIAKPLGIDAKIVSGVLQKLEHEGSLTCENGRWCFP